MIRHAPDNPKPNPEPGADAADRTAGQTPELNPETKPLDTTKGDADSIAERPAAALGRSSRPFVFAGLAGIAAICRADCHPGGAPQQADAALVEPVITGGRAEPFPGDDPPATPPRRRNSFSSPSKPRKIPGHSFRNLNVAQKIAKRNTRLGGSAAAPAPGIIQAGQSIQGASIGRPRPLSGMNAFTGMKGTYHELRRQTSSTCASIYGRDAGRALPSSWACRARPSANGRPGTNYPESGQAAGALRPVPHEPRRPHCAAACT